MTKVTFLLTTLVAVAACSDGFRADRVTDLALTAERVLAPFTATPETEALLKTARDAAWHLDVARLHDALPPATGPERFVVFEGRQVAAQRVVSHELPRPRRDLLEVLDPPHRSVGDEPGDGWLFAGVAPLAHPSTDYRLRVTTMVTTGAGDGFVFWRELPMGLRLLERELETKAPGEDVEISSIGDLRRRFPATTEFLLRYVEALARRESSDRSRVRMKLKFRTRFDALGADYPTLAAYAARIARSFRSAGALETEGGAALASWSVRGPEEGLRVELAARDGRLVPDGSSPPPVDLLAAQRLRFATSSSMALYGVKNTIEGVRGTVSTEPNVAAVFVDVNGEPSRVAIEGAFAGVVPVGAVDVMIPGDLETIFRGILSTFLRGRGGRGVALVTESRQETPERHRLSSTLLSDVPSGSLARIGLRLAADRIRASDAERADLLRFGRDLVERFRRDLPERKRGRIYFPSVSVGTRHADVDGK